MFCFLGKQWYEEDGVHIETDWIEHEGGTKSQGIRIFI